MMHNEGQSVQPPSKNDCKGALMPCHGTLVELVAERKQALARFSQKFPMQ
jgi:hypothetical protein